MTHLLSLSPSTHRLLSLSVGLSWIGLGSLYLINDGSAVKDLFCLWPSPGPQPSSDKASTSTSTSSVTVAARTQIPPPIADSETEESRIRTALQLLAARDMTIGTAILALTHLNLPRSAGVTILCGLVTCAADVVIVWRRNGWRAGMGLMGGAGVWAGIGWGMVMQ